MLLTLKAMDRWEVDYFSLDVEGNELDILKTIPFHLINIKATNPTPLQFPPQNWSTRLECF
jgi:hypothetical protein